MPVTRQCALLQLPRSSAYYTPNTTESAENLALMRLIDEQYMVHSFYGSPRMAQWLDEQGHCVNVKRVARLMRVMGLQATMPGPHTSRPHPQHKIYPYLLRGMVIGAPNEVWSTDITYIPMRHGFMYLVAVMDWFSRYVIAWDLSNSMEVAFCVGALEEALRGGRPGIFNTDQGSQFTSPEWTGRVEGLGIKVSMDGKGRWMDNIFIERLWRSYKYEDLYLKEYATLAELEVGIRQWMERYNTWRPHQTLGNKTPSQVYETERKPVEAVAEMEKVA